MTSYFRETNQPAPAHAGSASGSHSAAAACRGLRRSLGRMNHHIIYTVVTALSLLLNGCADAIHEHVTGPYILIAIDVDEQLSVSRDEGHGISIDRIGPVVIDVGWNTNYIVATVRPKKKPGTPLSYYFLDIAKDSGTGNQYQAVTGPLTKDEFEKAKQKLGLPEFSRHFAKLR